MPSVFIDTPEDLVVLRTSVEDWLEKATTAVWSFRRPDGLFWRDTSQFEQQKQSTSLTSTVRSYIALAYANRHPCERQSVALEKWIGSFKKIAAYPRLDLDRSKMLIDLKNEKEKLNNFELAHLADVIFVKNFIDRFNVKERDGAVQVNLLKGRGNYEIKQAITKRVITRLGGSSARNIEEGEVFFDPGQRSSRHFFVTLHSLRALAIVDAEHNLGPDTINALTDSAASFCVQQCFYSTRGLHHLQDTSRLAFAGVIYALYAAHVDKELCQAIVEALADAQLDSGNWPATHPIIRENNEPWYIATHEIALCLTWLYFQPRVPDAARPVLLSMLERYFTKWVIPTYLRIPSGKGVGVKVFEGWYDDRATGHNEVVGWATAIVCHFLANYLSVLNDHINRRVIENLSLQAYASGYLIDETQHNKNSRWTKDFQSGKHVNRRPMRSTWPDVPPFAWPMPRKDPIRLANEFSWKWTDPKEKAALSKKLAKHVIVPVLDVPEMIPKCVPRGRQYAAGILDGPPGTRKTSFVKTIARFMEWSLVPVPASVIFERGFDLMEARASEVFRNLNYLTQCVIFFDEFEEFFKDRGEEGPQAESKKDDSQITNCSEPSIHDRTIAAFTTSAMLPRLQDLRDEGRCLIFLATNHVGKIDDAIIRPGRFDFKETIGHPKTERFLALGKSYLDRPTKRTLEELDIAFDADKRSVKGGENGTTKLRKIREAVKAALKTNTVKEALKEFNDKQKKNRGEEEAEEDDIPFNFVEEAMRRVAGKLPDTPKSDLAKEASNAIIEACERAMDEKGPPGLPELGDDG